MRRRGVVRRTAAWGLCLAILAVGSVATAPTSAASPPAAAPTGVTVAVTGGLAATVSWTAPPDDAPPRTGYRIWVGRPGEFVPVARIDVGASETSRLVHLNLSGRYFFRVAAVNADGEGPYSSSSGPRDIGPGAPGAPATVSVVSALDTSAVVTWSQAFWGGSSISQYSVIPEVDGVAQPAQTFSSGSRLRTITGLTPGLSYRFRVSATNALGTGLPSSPSAEVTLGAPSPPPPPVAMPGPDHAVVSWSASAETYGSPVIGYRLTTLRAGTPVSSETFLSPDRTQTIGPLETGVAHTFQVAAISAVGTGLPSTESVALIVGSPSPPLSITATAGSLSATVAWSPAGDNGSSITSHRIFVGVAGSVYPIREVVVGPDETSAVITGLTAGRRHFFFVSAMNGRGQGPYGSSSNRIVVSPGAPSAPTGVSAVVGESAATVSWTAPYDGGSPITGYEVIPEIDGVPQPSQAFSSASTTQTVVGLTQGTSYRFRVAAINAGGTSSPSNASPAIVVGVPSAPRSPVALPGNTSALVSWAPPLTTNGSPILGYVVTPYRLSGVPLPSQTFLSPALSQTVVGLTQGSYYTFRVAAFNEHGTGLPSLESPYVSIGAPAAPTDVSAVAGVRSATVSWEAPEDNGLPITGYKIWVGIPGALYARVDQVGLGSTTVVVTGLTPGQPYFFRVAAVSSHLVGPWSAGSLRVTPTA